MTKLDSIEPKPKMKIIEPNKDDKPNEEIDNSSDDYSDDNDSCYDQGMIANYEDEEDDESDDEDEKEPMVLKAYQGKKISAELTKKTPSTLHPPKETIKSPTNNDKKKEQNKKIFACASCNKSFGSEVALQSRMKAKHNALQTLQGPNPPLLLFQPVPPMLLL
ncbi:histone deacetylase HDT2-like [Hevea brasiliensis]|uniref:histone deacetylase HDT2-like n=1 Tax=Hevea brasiliensis TaxID=3981 RepID=UPI0025DBA428|nr:histone deacetylase HDT2-like [Hevea brasiliensis]